MSSHVTREPFATTRDDLPAAPVELAPIHTSAIYVLHTALDETVAAWNVARDFAEAMRLPVTIVHVRAVPFPTPVAAPAGVSPIETAEFKARMSQGSAPAELRVVLCRNEERALREVFPAHSLIVVAGRRHRLWSSWAERCRALLESDGHYVVFVDATNREEGAHA